VLKLHEAWFEIARRIYNGEATWICNAAARLNLATETYEKILARIRVERRRQRGGYSLWRDLGCSLNTASRVARIRFIAAELRRLARKRS